MPSMEKKRTVYQMALSKMAQPCSPGCPGPLTHAPWGAAASPTLFLPARPLATSDLITSYPILAVAIKYELPPLSSASTSLFLLPPLHLPSCDDLLPSPLPTAGSWTWRFCLHQGRRSSGMEAGVPFPGWYSILYGLLAALFLPEAKASFISLPLPTSP